jgi:hypothetical protein
VRRIIFSAIVLLASSTLRCEAINRFWIAAQHSYESNRGFYLDFENDGADDLNNLKLVLGAGDGAAWHFATATLPWQVNHDYHVTATLDGTSNTITIDGNIAAATGGQISAFNGPLTMNRIPEFADWNLSYVIRVSEVHVSGGTPKIDINFGLTALPVFMFDPESARRVDFTAPQNQRLTIDATIQIVPRPNVRTLGSVVDQYGQATGTGWAGKIARDSDLTADVSDEQKKLRNWPAPTNRDAYGGLKEAGTKPKPTGFFRVEKQGAYWWLISPAGNRCFYTGVSTAPNPATEKTLITSRDYLFQSLPAKSSPFDVAWGKDPWGVGETGDYFSFSAANLVRKYGRTWQQTFAQQTTKRLKAWGFCGLGKWVDGGSGLPETVVLKRGNVPLVGRHPDIFDPAIQSAFRGALEKQIAPRKNDPMVVGWSVGNEFDELVTPDEIRQIVAMGANVPAKRALIDNVLSTTYGGSVAQLAIHWNIHAATREDVYASTVQPPAEDVAAMRKFFADQYYDYLYRTVKAIDPNHLYLGFWIVPGLLENEDDWQLIARHCDVIGYDRYALNFSDSRLDRLMQDSDKPVLCGEFSFPPSYSGQRGFGTYPSWTSSDAEAGKYYAQWIGDATQNRYCIGTIYFEYRDQPITGRGPGVGEKLVLGEHYAFGLIDICDHPKWDLLGPVRSANLSASANRATASATH